MQRGTRIYLWPKFSEYPVARHFVYLERSIWDAISKTLLACTVATPRRVGFARGGKLLPFVTPVCRPGNGFPQGSCFRDRGRGARFRSKDFQGSPRLAETILLRYNRTHIPAIARP